MSNMRIVERQSGRQGEEEEVRVHSSSISSESAEAVP